MDYLRGFCSDFIPIICILSVNQEFYSHTGQKIEISTLDSRGEGRYRQRPTARHFLRPCRRTKDTRCANYSSQPPKRHIVPPHHHPSGHTGTNSLQTRADRPCSASSLRRCERLIYPEVWFSLVTQPGGFTFKYDRGTGGCFKASERIFIKLYSSLTVFLRTSLCSAGSFGPPLHAHTP